MKIPEKIKTNFIIGLLCLATIFGIVVIYKVTNKVHYSWKYEDHVKQTIRDMVKPEYLREGK